MYFEDEFYNLETIGKSDDVLLNICELCFKTNIVKLDKLTIPEIGIQCSDSNCENQKIKYLSISSFINLLKQIKESKNEKYPTPQTKYVISQVCYNCRKNDCGNKNHPYFGIDKIMERVNNEIIDKVEDKIKKNKEILELMDNLYQKSKQILLKKIEYYKNIQNLIEILQDNYRYRDYDINNINNLIQCLSFTFPDSEVIIYKLLQDLDKNINSFSKKQITISEININNCLINLNQTNDSNRSDIINNLLAIPSHDITFYSNSNSSNVTWNTKGNLQINSNNKTLDYDMPFPISSATWISKDVLAFSHLPNLIGIWIKQNQNLKIMEAHDDIVNKVITLKEYEFASCSNDNTIKIWRYSNTSNNNNMTIKQVSIIKDHHDWVNSIILLKNNNYLVSGSAGEDDSVRIFDLNNGNKCIHVFENVECCYKNSLMEINEQNILVGGLNKIVYLNIITKKKEMSFTTDGYVTCFYYDKTFTQECLYGCHNKIYYLHLYTKETKVIKENETEIRDIVPLRQ